MLSSKKKPIEIPIKKTTSFIMTINSIVAKILAVESPLPSPVISIAKKQLNAAKLAARVPRVL